MNPNLKSKLLSWSPEKLVEVTNYLPVTDINYEYSRFVDRDDLGYYGINKFSAYYFRNDGIIEFLIDNDFYKASDDFAILTELYNQGLADKSVRFIEPKETAVEDNFIYTKFASASGTLGTPFIPDYLNNYSTIGVDWVKAYIDQVGYIINKLKSSGSKFPQSYITFDNRLKDSSGYYYHSLYGFNLSYDEFIEHQLFKVFKNSVKHLKLDSVGIMDYAELKWA